MWIYIQLHTGLTLLTKPLELMQLIRPVNVVCFPRTKNRLVEVIQNYEPIIQTVEAARILLVGPVGAGKSSFFNSINSVFRGNMTSQAIAGTAHKSVTTQVPTQVLECMYMMWIKPLALLDHFMSSLICAFPLLVPLRYISCPSYSSAPTPSRTGREVKPCLWSCATPWGWKTRLMLVWTLRT